MALAYATTALVMLADKFSLYLHVKGLNFAVPLPSLELNAFISIRIGFYLHETDVKDSVLA